MRRGAETPVVGHDILSAADTPAVAPARGGSHREAPCPRRALGSGEEAGDEV